MCNGSDGSTAAVAYRPCEQLFFNDRPYVRGVRTIVNFINFSSPASFSIRSERFVSVELILEQKHASETHRCKCTDARGGWAHSRRYPTTNAPGRAASRTRSRKTRKNITETIHREVLHYFQQMRRLNGTVSQTARRYFFMQITTLHEACTANRNGTFVFFQPIRSFTKTRLYRCNRVQIPTVALRSQLFQTHSPTHPTVNRTSSP